MIVEKKDGVYALEGEFDIFHARDVETQILNDYKGDRDIILDFKGVNFMDSTGLGILISILKTAENNGHKVKILNAQSRIKKVFEITELDEVFDIGE